MTAIAPVIIKRHRQRLHAALTNYATGLDDLMRVSLSAASHIIESRPDLPPGVEDTILKATTDLIIEDHLPVERKGGYYLHDYYSPEFQKYDDRRYAAHELGHLLAGFAFTRGEATLKLYRAEDDAYYSAHVDPVLTQRKHHVIHNLAACVLEWFLYSESDELPAWRSLKDFAPTSSGDFHTIHEYRSACKTGLLSEAVMQSMFEELLGFYAEIGRDVINAELDQVVPIMAELKPGAYAEWTPLHPEKIPNLE